MKISTTGVFIASLALISKVDGFTVSKSAPASTSSHISRSNTQLHLLPTQGKQLVAASSTAYNSVNISSSNNSNNSISSAINDFDEDTDVMVISSTTTTNGVEIPQQYTAPRRSLASARKLVSRLFHLPASFLHHHTESIEDNSSFNIDDDEVLFPIVGFQFVTDGPDHCSVLPTTSNPSCRLHKKDETVYGWYTTACKLQCTDENYAAAAPKLEGLAP